MNSASLLNKLRSLVLGRSSVLGAYYRLTVYKRNEGISVKVHLNLDWLFSKIYCRANLYFDAISSGAISFL